MSKKEMGIKRTIALSEAVKYLQDLASCLEKGEVYLQQGKEYLTLSPREKVFLEVSAKAKKDKEKLFFSIGWEIESPETEGEDIVITSEKPDDDVSEIEPSEENE